MTTHGPLHASTRAVRASIESDRQHRAVVPPLHLSSNFAFESFGCKGAYDYTRSGNPTRDALGAALADLEQGCGAIVTSSGMAALNVLFQRLQPQDLLLVPHDCYGGTYRLCDALAKAGRCQVLFVDQTDQVALREAFARRPAMVLVETPSNPLLRITDIQQVAKLARSFGALLAVDNTFLSPVLQRPLQLGADVVIHSTTKYLNGHSDVVGGALVAADEGLLEELGWWANCTGATGAPFDSFLTLRGIRTLQVRMAQHEESAAVIAHALDEHESVRKVFYPGLSTHQGHATAVRQQYGFGGMLSFEVDGGEPVVRRFIEALRCFSLAESLGGVESLVCHPPTMTHAPVATEVLTAAGISQSLIRLSVGLEHTQDLLDDVFQALAQANTHVSTAALTA